MKDKLNQAFQDPVQLVGIIAVGLGLIAALTIYLPFRVNTTYGSQALLEAPDPLALKGHEVYYQEGCQYCHSQTVRPIASDVSRFASDSYGYYKAPVAEEYMYESPAQRGSTRIGPDLARLAGSKSDGLQRIKNVLTADARAKEGAPLNPKGLYHNYEHLYECSSDMVPVFMSWKVRMMMESRTPFSDDYQKSVFSAMEEQTRADALGAYLMSLGRKQKDYAGKFYQN